MKNTRLMILILLVVPVFLCAQEWKQSGSSVYLEAPYAVGIQTIDQETTLGVDGAINANEFLINGDPIQLWKNLNGNLVYSGSVGVGRIAGEQMSVNGTTLAEKVIIDLKVPAPDYVFESSYQLPSLLELECYIHKNQHLPYFPSASKMAKEGLAIEANQMGLLRTIEELMLHQISMEKTLSRLEEAQNESEKHLESLKNE